MLLVAAVQYVADTRRGWRCTLPLPYTPGTPASKIPRDLGQVPNLYAADEMEKIVSMVRPLAKAAGKLETRDAILQHYVQLGTLST